VQEYPHFETRCSQEVAELASRGAKKF
jgi:hypothetical protein